MERRGEKIVVTLGPRCTSPIGGSLTTSPRSLSGRTVQETLIIGGIAYLGIELQLKKKHSMLSMIFTIYLKSDGALECSPSPWVVKMVPICTESRESVMAGIYNHLRHSVQIWKGLSTHSESGSGCMKST
jgi:hypothetical protein